MQAQTSTDPICIDAAIVGGGIAGAWALNLLRAKGYNAILLEAGALGQEQTLASQGMIHGGLKYALGGRMTGAAEAIAAMPTRWRACLRNDDPVALQGTRLLSAHYYMYAARTTLGRLTTFFASKALRGRIAPVPQSEWPDAFAGFDGVLYTLNDFVLDTADLLQQLTAPHADRVFRQRADAQTVTANPHGGYTLALADRVVHARQLICCAGNGSEALLHALNIEGIDVQYRPLKQVIVRPKHDVALYAHCLTGVTRSEPRLTITSHDTADGLVWYLGGQLATEGVARSDDEPIARAQHELQTCVPWLDWHDAAYELLTINRAEPRQHSGLKPDQAYVRRLGDFIQCFPTKLTLAPDMGDRLLAALDAPQSTDTLHSQHPLAVVGHAPW